MLLAETWETKRILVFALPFALLLVGGVAWLFLRKTFRTRLRVSRALRDDPDINEWLVIFNWSRKVLYVPTIAASFGCALAMLFIAPDDPQSGRIVGGVWLGVFILNFLVDEYEMSVKLLLLTTVVVLLGVLWLLFLDWLDDVFYFFGHLGVRIDAMGYLVIGLLFLMAVVVSWLHGLFYYVAITPNYLNIQVGPTETGEQIAREEYSTRVDTGDFLERLQGFGRIIITFADQRRQPLIFLVGGIAKKAAALESVRGKLAFDRLQPSREGTNRPGHEE